MTTTTKLLRRAGVALAVALGAATSLLPAPPASAATEVEPPYGVMVGTAAAPTYLTTLTVDARGNGGTLTVHRGTTSHTVQLDCVHTYGVVGVILSVPIVAEYGYASGLDESGQRWYLYVNEGIGMTVDTVPGPPVRSVDTCGVGYQYSQLAATGIAIVPETTTVWTPLG